MLADSDAVREERARLAELDSLAESAKKDVRAAVKTALEAYLNAVKNDEKAIDSAAQKAVSGEDDAGAAAAAERLIAASYLLGMEHAGRDMDGSRLIEAADDVPPVPFAEAAEFLRAKIPLTKKEWDALEPMVRFRAFTVARLSAADYIEAAKGILADAVESGVSYAETWRQVSAAVADDALKLRPGYWENVYRTNTQSAYIAGKLKGWADNPPAAIRLLVIDDSRTSPICRHLLSQGSSYG
ncbi:MAG: phage head morphogenesis protein, partial [Treponemataceae bacterium]|nr:phage head morphogenesis protein [Treponemataceae bacterium]